MDLRKLKKLIDLVQESGISGLVTEGEERSASPNTLLPAPPKPWCMPASTTSPWPSGRCSSAGSSSVDLDDEDACRKATPSSRPWSAFYRARHRPAPTLSCRSARRSSRATPFASSKRWLINEIEADTAGVVKPSWSKRSAGPNSASRCSSSADRHVRRNPHPAGDQPPAGGAWNQIAPANLHFSGETTHVY